MSKWHDEKCREFVGKLNRRQIDIIMRVRGDDWFPKQWEGVRALFGWNSLAALGLAYPREAGMLKLSAYGQMVRDYLVMLEDLA